MTPQDVSDPGAADKIREKFRVQGLKAVCYGMGDGLDEIKKASSAERNIVVSPAALECAKYLEKSFGTPYEVGYPLVDELMPELDHVGKKVLIVHQQVIANSIRDVVRENDKEEEVNGAEWFTMEKEIIENGDVKIRDEDDSIELVENGSFDVIFADPCMNRMVPGFAGEFEDAVHFAVSGKCR